MTTETVLTPAEDRRTRTRPRPGSALRAAQRAFHLLVQPPVPLSLDCRDFDPELGIPAAIVPLDQLQQILLSADTSYAARDAVWRKVCRAAREWGPQWVVAAAGLALPGLKRAARELYEEYGGDRDDIDSEVLTGFLEAVRGVDLDSDRLAAALVWRGRRAGHRLIWADKQHRLARSTTQESQEPRPLYGHPDLLLGRAVARGVITVSQAVLIAETRLEGASVETVADRFGRPAQALRMVRRRAELRIVAALRDGTLT
ncbi:hypothetical protein [Catellatospora paridis]|uniref:hypothetical protein n=1 Tax=Catellatospora paridis TaxID=1617086 RepID=UPI0012D40B2B|nr:hypothetical protein [Catellatospora paridis]